MNALKTHAKCWNLENLTQWSCTGLQAECFGFKNILNEK
jgi:hypothetical protein